MNPIAGGGVPKAVAESFEHHHALDGQPEKSTQAAAHEAFNSIALAFMPEARKRGVPCLSFINKDINTSIKTAAPVLIESLSGFISSKLADIKPPLDEAKKEELLKAILNSDALDEINGLCLGHSWMFGALMLEMSESHPRLSAEALMQAYESSRFYTLASPFVFLAYIDFSQMVSLTEGEASLTDYSPELLLHKKLDSLKLFLKETGDPTIKVSYPYIEEKTPHILANEEVIAKIKKGAEIFDIESIEDPIEKIEELKSQRELSQENLELLEFLELVISQVPYATLMQDIDEKHLAGPRFSQSIKEWAVTNNGSSCILNFNIANKEDEEEESIGHATCFFASVEQGVFVYFDANEGIVSFPDVDSMSTYIARTLNIDYAAQNISCCILTK
jgi:hypothetical protein